MNSWITNNYYRSAKSTVKVAKKFGSYTIDFAHYLKSCLIHCCFFVYYVKERQNNNYYKSAKSTVKAAEKFCLLYCRLCKLFKVMFSLCLCLLCLGATELQYRNVKRSNLIESEKKKRKRRQMKREQEHLAR